MEVQINSLPIDFTFENEHTLRDVVDSISRWVKERNLIFTEVFVDGERHSVDQIPARALEQVGLVNSIVLSKADVVISTIDEGIQYCDRVLAFIAGTKEGSAVDQEKLRQLSAGIDWLAEVYEMVFQLAGLDTGTVKFKDESVGAHLARLVELRDRLAVATNGSVAPLFGEAGGLFTNIKDILRMLLLSDEMKQLIINSIDSPDRLAVSLNAIADALPAQAGIIEEAVIAFQSGKDRDGIAKMTAFIDFIYVFIRTCYQLSPVFSVDLSTVAANGVSLDVKIRELQNFLNDMTGAMENADIISLADVLGYEIKPAVEGLGVFITALQERLGG